LPDHNSVTTENGLVLTRLDKWANNQIITQQTHGVRQLEDWGKTLIALLVKFQTFSEIY